ncbi:phosphatase PAP2 family protein [Thalassotalea sp. M1531]|uniref:undecaprenyl-diphosphate phosphatase n=1 Tax=Thalassotalea algicola TaxID=2716224 RepID=A0A7Y0Q671_9GAMM|nr:phosphatase PAP2 family protein [Thalassotalea algicola]NMP30512.1 phosphatase PAP2 family protein [Thalassotalea algicola]
MTVLNDIYQYDLRILKWCVKSRYHQKFIATVRAISRTGDGYLQILLPLIISLFTQSLNFFWFAMTAFAIERLLYFILKHTLKRKRPPDVVPNFSCVVQPSDKFSFPSGHTMAAFLLVGLVVFELGLIALPLYIWATAVGASRVILGVHFPSDILAGATLGTVILLGLI